MWQQPITWLSESGGFPNQLLGYQSFPNQLLGYQFSANRIEPITWLSELPHY
jgi:hypothetical protein